MAIRVRMASIRTSAARLSVAAIEIAAGERGREAKAGFVGMERSALHRKLKSLNVVTSSRSGARVATVAEEETEEDA